MKRIIRNERRITQEDLIAYQMGELSRWQSRSIQRALDRDPALAAEAEEIASTLRAFSGEPVPSPSAETMSRSWERVRSNLLVLEPAPSTHSGKRWFWAGTSLGVAATVALVVVLALHSLHVVAPAQTGSVTQPAGMVTATRNWSQNLLAELHKPRAAQVNQRPGPLTTAPVDAVAEDPALAAHLDTAERVLTEVSHVDGPLPLETRDQVHRLLLQNAVYHQSAERHGDLATAAVIDDLGRVLISLDAEPHQAARGEDAFRLEMRLGGVLLDLRILHHNDVPRPLQ